MESDAHHARDLMIEEEDKERDDRETCTNPSRFESGCVSDNEEETSVRATELDVPTRNAHNSESETDGNRIKASTRSDR